jgi:hypothetical protein
MDAAPFEPMSVGQILDRTFLLYRNHFVRFLAVVAVVQVPLALVSILITTGIHSTLIADGGADLSAGALVAGLIGLAVTFLLLIVAQQLANGALIKAVSESYLGGDASVGECYAAVLPRVLTLLVASFAVGILVLLGLILCIVPGVILMLLFAVVTPVIVVEDVGISSSLSRSKALVSGNMGKVFAVVFVAALIVWIVNLLFQRVGIFVAVRAISSPAAAGLVAGLIAMVGQILAVPISATAIVLLYYDLRIRKEGFDLEMLAQSMGSELPPAHDT